jgi:hypothetical protein
MKFRPTLWSHHEFVLKSYFCWTVRSVVRYSATYLISVTMPMLTVGARSQHECIPFKLPYFWCLLWITIYVTVISIWQKGLFDRFFDKFCWAYSKLVLLYTLHVHDRLNISHTLSLTYLHLMHVRVNLNVLIGFGVHCLGLSWSWSSLS